ncbi:hypothetical protein ECDEC6E_1684 [Escherichia coli DEC6E]|nr:hypothetical protein ECDEC6D_1747 [Escherichia coli DEC6D]EHV75696.1 hypothetical protein ECDEC6E_1684 [Escherichia coli DEC6E]
MFIVDQWLLTTLKVNNFKLIGRKENEQANNNISFFSWW